MKKIWAVAGAFILVGTLLGYGIGNYTASTAVEEAYAEGMAYQASITPQSTVSGTPASMDVDFDVDEFDHSASVDADGAVAADVDVTHTITITNDDETRTAEDVYIMLWSPVSEKEGLDDELEEDEFTVAIDIGGLTKKLYNSKEYSDGYLLGDIEPGDEFTLDVTITFEEADDDTFEDGNEYDCKLYVYQPDADYADVVDFTVLT